MSKSQNKKFTLKEVPVDLKRGFLTRYWNAPDQFKKPSFFESSFYYFSKALNNLKAMPYSNFLSILTVAFSLFLLGAFILALRNLNSAVSEAGDGGAMVLYLKKDLSKDELSSLLGSLKSKAPVISYNYISKKEALEILRNELSENQNYLKGLEAGNPLPASLELKLDKSNFSVEEEALLVEKLLNKDLVSDVFRESQFLEKIHNFSLLLKLVGLVLVSILFLVVSFLVGNTVRLVVFSRLDEIKTMRMVGAKSSFVQIPYVLSGFLQGLIGSLIGLSLLYVSFLFLKNRLLFFDDLPFKGFELNYLNLRISILLILLGTFIGALASFITTRKISKA